MLIALLVLVVALLVVQIFVLKKLGATSTPLKEQLRESTFDLQSALTREILESSSKLKIEVLEVLMTSLQKQSGHLSSEFSQYRAEQEGKDQGFRKELRENLGQLSTVLETRFTGLQDRVNLRLEQIGKEVQEKLDKNIQDGFQHFEKVRESLVGAEKQLAQIGVLGQSIHDLNSVLNLPHLRGKIIGEGNLERLLTDFLPVGFYQFQYPIEGKIVDAVIKLQNVVLPIDSKFPMEQVAALFEREAGPEPLKLAREKLSEICRELGRSIKTKYIRPDAGTTDYALMYLPSETLYFEVIRDTSLWEYLVEQKVMIVSPNTLAITVHSISKTLSYWEMGKDVQKTLEKISKARKHMDHFRNQFEKIGRKLIEAQDAFSTANTHFTRYETSVQRLPLQDGGQEALPDGDPAAPLLMDGELHGEV